MHAERTGGFNHRDIRVLMDVWTADNEYLGSVRRVLAAGISMHTRIETPDQQVSGFSGEALGLVPTQALGSSGPVMQAAHAAYATSPDGAGLLGAGTMTVGHWAGLIGRRSIALDFVQSVSLERVTLRVTRAELDELHR